MATKRITERFAFSGGKVDREAGTITDCLISGLVSDNGRDYPAETYRRDYEKYEGAPSNCDHGADDTIDRRLGWFTGVSPGGDGKPRGTYHLLKSHPMYERVLEAAERNPRLYGFSHVIEAKTSRRNGREIVESIERVISIDLVATPATTRGLFESTGGRAVTTFGKLLESLLPALPPDRAKAVRKWAVLAEDDPGMAPMLDAAVDDPAADVSGDDAIKGGIRNIVNAILDDDALGADEKLKKIRLALQAGEKLTGKSADAGAGDSADAAMEARAAADGRAIREAVGVCRKVGFKGYSEEDLDLVALSPAEKREAVAKRLMGTAGGGERVESAGRHQAAALTEAEQKKLAEAAGKGDKARVTWD